MTTRARRLAVILVAILGALSGAALIVAQAPRAPAGSTSSAAAYGH